MENDEKIEGAEGSIPLRPVRSKRFRGGVELLRYEVCHKGNGHQP
jgi:hypothetical protein